MKPTPRGRPLKFGRPAKLLALTLPADVVAWLTELDVDPGWAIVTLYEQLTKHAHSDPRPVAPAKVELAQLSGKQSLIVVDSLAYRGLRGVALVPVGPRRALLALEPGRGLADLELSIEDLIEDGNTDPPAVEALRILREEIRRIRRADDYEVSTRSIVVVEKRRKRRRQ